jgi:hypothetical protein
MAKGKVKENKHRLREIKQILLFPETQVNETIKSLLIDQNTGQSKPIKHII